MLCKECGKEIEGRIIRLIPTLSAALLEGLQERLYHPACWEKSHVVAFERKKEVPDG